MGTVQTVKIIITGPFSSGKTEFIQTVSEIDVVSTERKITSESERIKARTTVAMDFGLGHDSRIDGSAVSRR